jgi:N-methylhydantoinase A/oxoprolinase/acetone carboxylase beta subunit
LVQELTDLPATCGHELTHRLDALRRATTVTLNGRLIPLLRALITAVERTMIEQGIRAPLMVVKGDGSLMEASMAKERPIETILSGPAASVVGAQHLAGGSHALVVDMGGTTTDVAVIQDGRPSLSPQGAQVGRWRTMVEAIDVHTVGLGGDSYVRLDENCDLHVGPRRVVPLCLLASEHPALVGALEQQLARAKATGADGEFIVYQRPDAHPEGERFSFEPELWAELRQGPRTLERVYQIMRYPQMYARYLERLERQGIVVRAAFTPTDAAHVLGRYQAWDGAAARLGAELLARRLGLSAEEVAARVLALTAERIATEVVAKLLHDDIGNGHHAEGDTVDSALIARALRPLQEAALHCALTVKPTLVAIGAPVNTYFPQVAQLLHAPLRIPHHTEVANAIGAVVGSVVYRVRALVMPQEDEGYRVHLPDQVRLWATLPEALDYAETQARAMALAGAQRSGAEDIRVQVERRDHSAPVATGWGEEVYLQTDLEVTAVGRPRLALR